MRLAAARWLHDQLTGRVDAASFAVFRMAMGLMLFYDAERKGLRFFAPNAERDFSFRYEYFYWLPENAAWAYPLQLAWLTLSVTIAVGLFYRLSCILVTVLLVYGFLLGQEYYLNHYYLLII
ncbi:MAG: HTTM domain-containing protein, partial [Roseovarius sp.]|nr:HTTM domain-containing protein [Roseovarius sp.]